MSSIIINSWNQKERILVLAKENVFLKSFRGATNKDVSGLVVKSKLVCTTPNAININ